MSYTVARHNLFDIGLLARRGYVTVYTNAEVTAAMAPKTDVVEIEAQPGTVIDLSRAQVDSTSVLRTTPRRYLIPVGWAGGARIRRVGWSNAHGKLSTGHDGA